MEDKLQKEPENLSDEEIQRLKDRWKKPENIELVKKVFTSKRLVISNALALIITPGYEWLIEIGKLFEKNDDFQIKYVHRDSMKIPILDFRYFNIPNDQIDRDYYQGSFLAFADFTKATLNTLNFRNSYFGETVFNGCEISATKYIECNFHCTKLNNVHGQMTEFTESHFQGTEFKKAFFMFSDFKSTKHREELFRNQSSLNRRGTDFTGAILYSCYFNNSELHSPIFRNTNLTNADFRNSFIANADWHGKMKLEFRKPIPKFENIKLSGFWRKVLSDCNNFKIFPDFKYSDTPRSAQGVLIAGADFANSRLFERYIKDEQFIHEFKENAKNSRWLRSIERLWFITSDYGRSILRWSMCSILLAGIFGLIYLILGPEKFDLCKWSIFAPFYYSIVTFTTLGFVDITPKITLGWLQAIVTLEVILGYIMLGGLISIFANKLARRAS